MSMQAKPQQGKCCECNENKELWYFDGGFFCKDCIRPYLEGNSLHDEFMLADWIISENLLVNAKNIVDR